MWATRLPERRFAWSGLRDCTEYESQNESLGDSRYEEKEGRSGGIPLVFEHFVGDVQVGTDVLHVVVIIERFEQSQY